MKRAQNCQYPRHPQSNGYVDAINKTILNYLMKRLNKAKGK